MGRNERHERHGLKRRKAAVEAQGEKSALLTNRKLAAPQVVGIVPDRYFVPYSCTRKKSFENASGIVPANKLSHKYSDPSCVFSTNDGGKVPEMSALPTCRCLRDLIDPSESGRWPSKLSIDFVLMDRQATTGLRQFDRHFAMKGMVSRGEGR